MKMCVFGGTGFLGRHFTAEIARAPGRSVRVITRSPERHAASSGITYVKADLLSPDTLADVIEPGDTVVNLAYLQGRRREENVSAITNLLNASLQRGAMQFLHCSTAVVVGRSDDEVVTETSEPHPVTEYERVKLEVERRVLLTLEGRLRGIVVRPTAIIGAGGGNLMSQIESLKRNPELVLRLKQYLFAGRTLNFVCVENVVSAMDFLLSRPPAVTQEIFIVSDDDSPHNTYPEVINLLAGRPYGSSSTRLEHRFLFWCLMSLLRRSNTNLTRRYSCAKLRSLGWTPPVRLVDCLKRLARSEGLHV